MKFQLVLLFTVVLATSAFGQGLLGRWGRQRANSKPQNPVPQGYLAHDFYNAANRFGDASKFQNFIPAYAKYLYNVQRDLENIESGKTRVDTSNMSPERAAAIEKAMQGLREAVPGFREAWTNIVAEMEDMDSLLQLPKSMARHMGGPFKGIMGNFAALVRHGAPAIVQDWIKNLMTLPPALMKDITACPMRFMAMTMGQVI